LHLSHFQHVCRIRRCGNHHIVARRRWSRHIRPGRSHFGNSTIGTALPLGFLVAPACWTTTTEKHVDAVWHRSAGGKAKCLIPVSRINVLIPTAHVLRLQSGFARSPAVKHRQVCPADADATTGVSGFALRVNLIHEKEMDDCIREALDGLRRLYKPRKVRNARSMN
jgi:hypothetical protein